MSLAPHPITQLCPSWGTRCNAKPKVNNIKFSVKHKRPNLDALPRNPGPRPGQVERAVRDGELLAPVRVVRVEDDHLGRQLLRHVVPAVGGVVVHLEDLVGHRREDLVHLEQITLGVYALGVDEGQGKVPTWSGEGLPDAFLCTRRWMSIELLAVPDRAGLNSLDGLVSAVQDLLLAIPKVRVKSGLEFGLGVV